MHTLFTRLAMVSAFILMVALIFLSCEESKKKTDAQVTDIVITDVAADIAADTSTDVVSQETAVDLAVDTKTIDQAIDAALVKDTTIPDVLPTDKTVD